VRTNEQGAKKMKREISCRFGRGAALLTSALVLMTQAAQACPGCKEIVVDGQQAISPAGMGFAYSIGFMFLMVMSVIGSLVWMMIKSARLAWRPADPNGYLDHSPK
jgi:uncharacterized paraquat-inducible protein A